MRWSLIPLLLGASTAWAHAQTLDTLPGTTLLRLSATATRAVPPDYAVLRLGVNTEDKGAADAGRANARLVNQVITAVRQTGIPLDSISTGAYAVQANLRDRMGHVTGYTARAELSVVLHDLEQIGAVIDAALEAGATDVAPVSFAARSLDTARDSAYAAAVRDVYRRAEAVAAAAGGHIISAVDLTASERRARVPCVVCEEAPQRPDQTTVVTPGFIAVTVDIHAVFRIQVP
jgi:uncharacterized protein YggE